MKPTPDHCSDGTINALYDELKPAEATAKAMDRLNEVMHKPAEIDLRGRKLDIRYEYHGKRAGWSAIDFNSYDGAPDSDSNHIGYGPEKEDALVDLMDKIGPLAAEPAPKLRPSRVIHSSAFEPPTHSEEREQDPDDVDFDSDLEEKP